MTTIKETVFRNKLVNDTIEEVVGPIVNPLKEQKKSDEQRISDIESVISKLLMEGVDVDV